VKVLAVAAHPDDEILGVGGTLARHARRGDAVLAFVACCGTNLRYGAEEAARLRRAASEAAGILGLAEVRLGDLPDQGLDTLSLVKVVEPLEAILAEFRPDVVYSHFAGDVNRDHRILLEALAVAARPYSAPTVRRIASFETPSSTEWGGPAGLAPFAPNLFVDVSETLEAKLRAFGAYASEVRPEPHPRSAAALRARAVHWGSVVGCAAAEAFVVLRDVERA
jgi:LmbE family N-acetylglucosaminyl deacetylase